MRTISRSMDRFAGSNWRARGCVKWHPRPEPFSASGCMTDTVPIEVNAAPVAPSRGASSFGRRLNAVLRDQTALILLIVLVAAGGLASDVFMTSRNLLNILWAVSVLGIVAM